MRRSLERFRLPYITITPTFSICPRHGYLDGEHEFCPEVRRGEARGEAAQARRVTPHANGADESMNTMTEMQHLDDSRSADDERQRCEVWTRVMGYHRPVASFNVGKKGEHCERRFFREERARPPCSASLAARS